jgi:hypothetical protein
MRFVRKFAFQLAVLSLAAVPVVSIGCTDQGAAKPPVAEHSDTAKKADTKTPKSPKKKGAEAGSTMGDVGVKPPKVSADTKKN